MRDRPGGDLGARVVTQLAEDVGHVPLCGRRRNRQFVADLSVGLALRDQDCHLSFARTERRGWTRRFLRAGNEGTMVRRLPPVDDAVETPAALGTRQEAGLCVLELDARAGHKILDGARYEDFAWSGASQDALGDLDRCATEVVPGGLALAHVEPGPNGDPMITRCLDDGRGASDGTSRAVEGDQEA